MEIVTKVKTHAGLYVHGDSMRSEVSKLDRKISLRSKREKEERECDSVNSNHLATRD